MRSYYEAGEKIGTTIGAVMKMAFYSLGVAAFAKYLFF